MGTHTTSAGTHTRKEDSNRFRISWATVQDLGEEKGEEGRDGRREEVRGAV